MFSHSRFSIWSKRSAQTPCLSYRWLSVRFLGIISAQTFFIPKYSIGINCAVPLLLVCSPAITFTVRRQSFHTRVLTFWGFHPILTLSDIQVGCQTQLHSFLHKVLTPFKSMYWHNPFAIHLL
jgi:hypothetical protein